MIDKILEKIEKYLSWKLLGYACLAVGLSILVYAVISFIAGWEPLNSSLFGAIKGTVCIVLGIWAIRKSRKEVTYSGN